MSSNETNKNCLTFQEFKFPISRSLNNSLLDEVPSHTPQKDIFLRFKPQMNMNNLLLNINTSNISPNKFSFEPRLFINDYNSGNKNNNSGIAQEKMNINSLLFFNSTKKEKEKKFVGKKRRFKYILSSEKKIKGIENKFHKNKNINIKQISLHGHHLLNLDLIDNNNEYNIKNISFPRKLIKFLNKKFPYFNIMSNRNNNNSPKKEYNLENIILLSNELKANNLDYFPGEINCEKILKKYCEEMQNTLEKIKNNYLSKKKFIYITKNILLMELLIRNYNLFTNYLLKKNSNQDKDNSPLNKLILFSTKQSIPLPNKKFLENLAEDNTTTKKKENISSLSKENNSLTNKQKTTIFRAKILMANTYKCDFCPRIFKNGQALGGHISQSHPNQSDKYKQKIEIRKSRTDRRELLYEARRRLFKAYNIDLDYLIKNKRKNEIKNFIKMHKVEYKKELNALKNHNNNINHINTSKNQYDDKSKNNSDIDIEINTSSKEKEKIDDKDNDRNKL